MLLCFYLTSAGQIAVWIPLSRSRVFLSITSLWVEFRNLSGGTNQGEVVVGGGRTTHPEEGRLVAGGRTHLHRKDSVGAGWG